MEASGSVEKDFPGEGFGGGYKIVDQGGVIMAIQRMRHGDDPYKDVPVWEHIGTYRLRSKIGRECHMCGHEIKVGQFYYRIVGKLDGKFRSSVGCLPVCDAQTV